MIIVLYTEILIEYNLPLDEYILIFFVPQVEWHIVMTFIPKNQNC